MIRPDPKIELVIPPTTLLTPKLDVMARLGAIRAAVAEFDAQDVHLESMQVGLDNSTDLGQFQLDRIQHLRDSLMFRLLPAPFEMDPKALRGQIGFDELRRALAPSFAAFSWEDKIFWLNNLQFLVTGDVREFLSMLQERLWYTPVGQRVGFSVVARSGMGKSSMTLWLVVHNLPRESEDSSRTIQNAVFLEMPSSNRSEKFLPQNLCWAVGAFPSNNKTEGEIISVAASRFSLARVEALFLDEIVNVRTENIRRLFIQICNKLKNTLIVCMGTSTVVWAQGDPEVSGRWGESLDLKPYTGERLRALLTWIELLLPFTQPSYLALDQIKTGPKKTDIADGPAKFIEEWTGGVLREIMRLIIDACRNGVNDERITMENLQRTWNKMHRNPIDAGGRDLIRNR